MQQLKLNLNRGRWGGRRPGAGRKRIHSKGVAHVKREKVHKRFPLHVNFRFRTSVRNKDTLKLLKKAIQNARSHGLLVLHYSFQTNHIHLVVEAENNGILTQGMRSLTITFAKGLKKGRVQVERYHLHVLKTVREVKHALHYVLFNQQKHDSGTCSTINEYSSVLSMERGLQLVKKYARNKKVWLKVERGETWKGDHGISYLFSRGLIQLFR